MTVLLWTLQGLLAAAFLAHGLMFLFPPADLVPLMDATMPRPFRYFLGVAEVAAAVDSLYRNGFMNGVVLELDGGLRL